MGEKMSDLEKVRDESEAETLVKLTERLLLQHRMIIIRSISRRNNARNYDGCDVFETSPSALINCNIITGRVS
ncbi:unnamed protein product [Litomosoides sigmodontis]|uniref:Uncharacterized protein n=1 Tax=Litomosoides sigmodontis TaxID=42156 RepID=A0A3P6T7L3_LITSI|nr:unnamed protein product [Litomosoides sigmodontis]